MRSHFCQVIQSLIILQKSIKPNLTKVEVKKQGKRPILSLAMDAFLNQVKHVKFMTLNMLKKKKSSWA